MSNVWLALGANVHSRWGTPYCTLSAAIRKLEKCDVRVVARSRFSISAPLGFVRQPSFVNAVIGVTCSIAPSALLRLLKRLERDAGRRPGIRWGPRPLDLDILDFGGRRIGRPSRVRELGRLILPHPEMVRRKFVLAPLAEVAPGWRHPILGVSARTLLARLARPRPDRTKPSRPAPKRGRAPRH